MKALGFPVSLLIGGLVCALLIVAAGRLLGDGARGGRQGARNCASFFVGLRPPGDTHVHLRNESEETIVVLLEVVNENGDKRAVERYTLGPNAAWDVVLGRLGPDIGFKVSSSSPDLGVHAEIVFNNGSESESYRAGICA